MKAEDRFSKEIIGAAIEVHCLFRDEDYIDLPGLAVDLSLLAY